MRTLADSIATQHAKVSHQTEPDHDHLAALCPHDTAFSAYRPTRRLARVLVQVETSQMFGAICPQPNLRFQFCFGYSRISCLEPYHRDREQSEFVLIV